jgi:dTDP-4-dehydrorhamnose 3,5-epimerase
VPFNFERLNIPDVVLVKPKVFRDPRGYFMEAFASRAFEAAGIGQSRRPSTFIKVIK